MRSLLVAALLPLALVPFAMAESDTVQGTGVLKKMSVNNGERKVTVKLKGFDPPCEAHYFKVLIMWGKKKAYQADAGCYPGGQWIESLYYYPNRNNTSNGDPVGCEKFKVVYDKDLGGYRVVVPRKCIGLAADKIKVRAEGDNYASPVPGEAGPTKALARG
jgi:hypothetical protein